MVKRTLFLLASASLLVARFESLWGFFRVKAAGNRLTGGGVVSRQYNPSPRQSICGAFTLEKSLKDFRNGLLATEYEIVTEFSNPAVASTILSGLEQFNLQFFKKRDPSFALDSFVIYAKDDQSQIIGGLSAYIFERASGSWIAVDYAWVEEKMRHQGIGTKLFKELEEFAREKHCTHIQLFTWAYQAPEFYKKLGFECVGTIPAWTEEHDAVFFRKLLK